MNIESEKENEVYLCNKNIIATITHDLKTPAVAQIRALEILLNGSLGEVNDMQKNLIKDIINSGNNMLYMLLNMLLLYKLDNKKIAMTPSKFCINEIIHDIFVENKLLINSKKQNFEILLNKKYCYIIADKMHIKRVITNFIINAINHSKENSTINIYTSKSNDNFIFKVQNYGDYVTRDVLDCIFERNKAFTQKCDGLSTGLGLYLSNEILKMNNASMFYNSEKGGLNTFGFSIKLFDINPNKNS